MFLMISYADEEQSLAYNRLAACPACGMLVRYEVYMLVSVLRLFFIPVLKRNRRYFVRTRCCGAVFSLDPTVGARIAAGEDLEINAKDLHQVQSGSRTQRCPACGFEYREDFSFCPKCGRKL